MYALLLSLVLNAGPQSRLPLSLQPAQPVQGAVFTITIKDDSPADIRGVFAGEPLHFHRIQGGFRALAGVPVDAPSTLTAEITTESASPQTFRVTVPIKKGNYRTQRLRVAGQFGREPDAATRARIERESELARQVSRNSHQTPRMWKLPFVKPAAGRVTSPFGTARVYNGQLKSRHNGVDFGGGTGAPVKASNDGTVALIGSFYYGGNCVYVDHGSGIVTAYLHLSKTLVKQGQQVVKGQTIGRIGATGRVTGPHLHFIARYGAISLNGLSLLKLGAL